MISGTISRRASDCLIWRNLSHKNKNMMAGHFSHLLLPALFHLCLQKWGNFSGYMPYSLAALDETSSLDSHNGTKTFLKLHFNSHTPMISRYIFHSGCRQKEQKLKISLCNWDCVSTFTCANRIFLTPGKLSSGEQLRLFALCALPLALAI